MSRAWPISTKFVRVPDSAGVSNPPDYSNRMSNIRVRKKRLYLLHRVYCAFIFVLRPVADQYTVWYNKTPFLLLSFLSRKVTDLWNVFPFFIRHYGQAALQVRKLLLNFGSFRTMLRQFRCFPGLSVEVGANQNIHEADKETDRKKSSPSRAPSSIHVLIYLLIYPVCFLIVRLISHPSEETDFIVGILKLLWINISFLAAASLSLTKRSISTISFHKAQCSVRYDFC